MRQEKKPIEMSEEDISYLCILYKELEDTLRRNEIIKGDLSSWKARTAAVSEIKKYKSSVKNEDFKIEEDFLKHLSPVKDKKAPDHKPTDAKLSIIAAYLEYNDWDHFREITDKRTREYDEQSHYLRIMYKELEHKLEKKLEEKKINGGLSTKESWDLAAKTINDAQKSKLEKNFFANLLPLSKNEKPTQRLNDSDLDILVKFLGYRNWTVFKSEVDDRKREKVWFDPNEIKVDKLKPDEVVTIGWYDSHYIRAKYKGKFLFEVIDISDTINKKIGDTFYAEEFGINYIWHYDEFETETEKGKEKVSISGYPRFPKIEIYSPFPSDEDREEIFACWDELDGKYE